MTKKVTKKKQGKGSGPLEPKITLTAKQVQDLNNFQPSEMQWLNDAVELLLEGRGILDILIAVYAVAATNGFRAGRADQEEDPGEL
jgi:hypothetical protein